MFLTLDSEQEADDRFIAEVPDLPSVLSYSLTQERAVARAQALVLRVLADRLKNGESVPSLLPLDFRAASESTRRMSEWAAAKTRRARAHRQENGFTSRRSMSRGIGVGAI